MAYPPVTKDEDDDDDWLEPPAQGGASDPLVNQEYTRISSKFSDAGYREGITDGKLATLQQGFDAGFAQSVPLSRRVGLLRGRAAALLAIVTTSSSSASPAASPSPSGPHSHASADLIDSLRDLNRRLSLLRRDEILPEDKERIEHEKEDHPDGEGYELDQTDKRDMESLERSLGSMGDAGASKQRMDGEVVIGRLEAELTALETALLRR
ncbi:hypothetical protein IAU59_005147 [Kwoniella sp. CBS 9459]